MTWLAVATLRARKAGFVGAFIALFCASVVVTACGILIETGLRGGAEPERYDAAPVVVAGADTVVLDRGESGQLIRELPERALVPDDVVEQVRAVDGVTRAEWIDEGIALGVYGDHDPDRLAHRVATVLPEHTVKAYTGDARGAAEFPEIIDGQDLIVAIFGSFAGIAVVIAVLVVAGTFGLLMQQRQRELALLRVVGATGKQVRSMVLRETQLVAVAAGALGVLPGLAVTGWLWSELKRRDIVSAGVKLTVGPLPMVIAVAIGFGIASLAGYLVALRMSRTSAVAALRETAVRGSKLGWARGLAAVAILGAAVPVMVSGPQATPEEAAGSPLAAVILLTVAIALVAPLIMRVAIKLVGWLLARIAPVSGYLAAATLRADSRRFSSAMVPLMLLIGIGGATIFFQTTTDHHADRQARDGYAADHVLMPAPGAVGIPGDVSAAVRDVPGVTGVTEVTQTGIIAHADDMGKSGLVPLTAQGVSPDASQAMDLDVRSGSFDDVRADAIALGHRAAEIFGADVGDSVVLHLGDGTLTELEVVATYQRDLGFGAVILPIELVRPHTTTGMSAQLLINGGDHTSLEDFAAERDGVHVVGQGEYHDALAGIRDAESWVNYLIVGVIVCYVTISVVNTLVMATGERSRELALVRLVGGTRLQLSRMLRLEALFTTAVAVVVGTGAMLLAVVPAAYIMTGDPSPSIPPLIYAGIVAIAAVLALASVHIPGRMLLSGRPRPISHR